MGGKESLQSGADNPKVVPVAPTVAPEVVPAPGAASSKEADKAAKKLLEDPEKLPSNEWSNLYKSLKQSVEENPESGGPLMNGLLQLVAGIAKMMKYADLIPGHFISGLDSDSALAKEKLSEKEQAKILATKRDQEKEKAAAEALKLKVTEAKDTNKKFGIEKASTNYVCSALLGIAAVDEPNVLAAKLKHSQKEVLGGFATYYNQVDFKFLKTNGAPYGSVIFFSTGIGSGERVAAFATGNSGEFQYFDPEKNDVVTFNINGKNSPLKGDMSLLAAFVPVFNSDPKFFSAHPDLLDDRVDETHDGKLKKSLKVAEGASTMTSIYKENASKPDESAANLKKYADRANDNLKESQLIIGELAATILAEKEQRPENVVIFKGALTKYMEALNATKRVFEIYKENLAKEGKSDVGIAKAFEEIDSELKKWNEYIAKL